MIERDRRSRPAAGTSGQWQRRIRSVGRVAFGDRVGLSLWLGLIVALALGWRVGFFVQADEYAIANTLVAVADGHLAIQEIQYSFSLRTQTGLHESGGRLYGRNYGQVALAVPLVWALEAATAVGPLHLVIAGAWSIALLAFGDQLATVTDRERLRGAACVLALGGFLADVALATPLDPTVLELAALQASTLLAAAFAGLVCYRLVGLYHDRTVAVAGGTAVAVSLPIGFWATVPKRHVLVSALVLAAVYGFARSRDAEGRAALVALASAYVATGLVAWVHAFEGFFAMTTLGVVDLVTGGLRSRRRVAAALLGALVGLAPMLVTNALISGDPLAPPRTLPNPGGGTVDLAPSGEVTSTVDGASGGEASRGDSDGSLSPAGGGGNPFSTVVAPLLGPFQGTIAQLSVVLAFAGSAVVEGIGVLADPWRTWHVFVRSGNVPRIDYALNDYAVVELTVLESAPLLGALLAVPVVAARRVWDGRTGEAALRPWRLEPRRQTDLLVASLAGILTLVYLHTLPLVSQITMRYLLPTFPLALYGVVRLPVVRTAVTESPRRLLASAVTAVVGGVVGVAAVLAWLGVAKGEAMQFHALVNLSLAAVLAGIVVARSLVPEWVPGRAVTVWLGVTAGITTAFLILARLEYFQHGPFALDIARFVAGLLPVF